MHVYISDVQGSIHDCMFFIFCSVMLVLLLVVIILFSHLSTQNSLYIRTFCYACMYVHTVYIFNDFIHIAKRLQGVLMFLLVCFVMN